VSGVVLLDQRLGVQADGAGDGADVAAGVEVAAAHAEVILLDGADDRLPYAGVRAHVRHG
jgi:hypothetical protein